MSQLNLKQLVAAQRRQLKQAQRLSKQLDGIQTSREGLDKQEADVRSALGSLGFSAGAKSGRKPGRKPGRKAKVAKRGRPAKVGKKAGRKPGRPAGPAGKSNGAGGYKNLTDLLVLKVLGKRPLGYDEIIPAAKAVGWETNSQKPKVAILQALRGKLAKGRVESAGRGLYVLAGSAAASPAKAAKPEGSKARKRKAAAEASASPAVVSQPATQASAPDTVAPVGSNPPASAADTGIDLDDLGNGA